MFNADSETHKFNEDIFKLPTFATSESCLIFVVEIILTGLNHPFFIKIAQKYDNSSVPPIF